jgi:hypothetical protein
MGIDRIGRGGGPNPASGAAPTTGAEKAKHSGEVTKTFEVGQSAPLSPTANVAAPAPVAGDPLHRVLSGEIDVDRYLDLKVDEATAHVHGLGSAEMSALRSILRAELTSDPALAALVQQAVSGRAPSTSG